MADLVLDASLASAWCFPDEQTVYTNGVLQAVSSSMEAFAPRLCAYEVRNSVLMGLPAAVSARLTPKGFWIPCTISTSTSLIRCSMRLFSNYRQVAVARCTPPRI